MGIEADLAEAEARLAEYLASPLGRKRASLVKKLRRELQAAERVEVTHLDPFEREVRKLQELRRTKLLTPWLTHDNSQDRTYVTRYRKPMPGREIDRTWDSVAWLRAAPFANMAWMLRLGRAEEGKADIKVAAAKTPWREAWLAADALLIKRGYELTYKDDDDSEYLLRSMTGGEP